MSNNLVEHAMVMPSWLQDLMSKVADSVEPLGAMGPIGYRWLEPNSAFNLDIAWLLAVYPTPYEVAGGSNDGQLMCPGFKLNLQNLLNFFTNVQTVAWRSPSVYTGDLDGPEIVIRGIVAEHPVHVRFFSIPPDDEKPSVVVNIASGECKEKAE